MIEEELIQIWQSSPNHERVKFEKSRLILDLQSSLEKFERTTRFWDFGTMISAVSVILVFGYQISRLTNLWAKSGVILIVVWCLFLILIVIKLKKTKPHEANSYFKYLKQHKQYLENQLSLSNKFMIFTVLPCFIGVVLIMVGKLDLLTKSWSEIASIKMFWVQTLMLLAIGLSAYYLNKWIEKREFSPRIKKVDELIRLLREED